MSILTLTVNPSLDLTTSTDEVENHSKLRCGPPRYDPGGGGVNVSRAIAKLGAHSKALIAVGGWVGSKLQTLIECENIGAIWFPVDGMTRQDFTVNERSSGKQFRFVLPGPEWSVQQTEALLQKFRSVIVDGPDRFEYVVLSGSLPPGMPDDFYHKIAALAAVEKMKFVLDTSGRSLRAAVCERNHPPYIMIMDHAEAEFLAKRPVADLEGLERLAREFHGRGLASIVVLTFSRGGAVAVSGSDCLRVVGPAVEVVSKVGAGDSFVAGLVVKLASGASLQDACTYAVAAASSAVTTPATELLDGPLTERLFSQMRSEQR